MRDWERARTDADAARTKALVSARTVRGILDLIGADTIEAAEQRLALSAQRARFEAQEQAAVTELHESGDGFSIDRLRGEAEQISNG